MPRRLITLLLLTTLAFTAAASSPSPQQAQNLSWVRSNIILYAIDQSGIVAIPIDGAKSSVLVPYVSFGGEILLLSPNKQQLFYGNQDNGYQLFDLQTRQRLDLSEVIPPKSIVQLSPNWSRLAWTNAETSRVGILDLPHLKNAEFALPTGVPAKYTIINSIAWSYDGSRVLVDTTSSILARKSIWNDPASMEPEAMLGYDPSHPQVTQAELDASMKEQYWALDPDNGKAVPITAILKPVAASVEPAGWSYAYPRQVLHYFQNGRDIGTDWSFACKLCDMRWPMTDIVLKNGTRISEGKLGGVFLVQPDGETRTVQAPLSPPVTTNLWAVFNGNYLLYGFGNQLWLYGIKENIKAPFPAAFSARFQF